MTFDPYSGSTLPNLESAGGGIELVGKQISTTDVNIQQEQSVPSEVNQGLVQRIDLFREEHPYMATMAETAVVWAGREATRHIVHRFSDVRLGHGWQNTRMGKLFSGAAVAVAAGVVAAPIAEEIAFRKQPSEYLDRRGYSGLQAKKGILAAAIFALGHAGPEALPVPQFVGGLNYWRLQRTRGTGHAILAHATNNSLSLAAEAINRRSR